MKHINNYIFALILPLCSCNSSEQKNDKATQEKVIAVESKGVPVSPDSIIDPAINVFGVPQKLPIKEDEKIPYYDNIHPITTTPQTRTLEKDHAQKHSTLLKGAPMIAAVIEKTLACILPEPKSVLPLRFRDYANCNLQYLDVTQGFNSSGSSVSTEDKDDNLWIATRNNLTRYNGRSYVDYAAKNEILQGVRPKAKCDNDGNLWVAIDQKGLLKYDGNRFTVYDTIPGLPKLVVHSMTFDEKNNLWLRINDGICYFDGKNFSVYTKENGLPSTNISSIVCGKDGKIWLGTSDTGLVCFDGRSFTSYFSGTGTEPKTIWSLTKDTRGNIWMCGEGMLAALQGNKITCYTVADGLLNGDIRKIMADHRGNIWLTHYRGGMSCFDGKNFTWFTDNEGLPVKTVYGLYEDRNGNIWAGTEGGGTVKYTSGSFKHITPKEGLKGIVISIDQDNKGNTWLASYDDGLFRFDGKQIVHIGNGDFFHAVRNMLHDSKDNMWFAPTGNCITKFDGKEYVRFSKDCGLFSNDILSSFEDSDGNIWFGSTDAGAIKFDGKQFYQYGKKQGLNSNAITDIDQDSKGNMWFGTPDGLNMMNGKTILSFKKEQGLVQNNIKNIAVDHNDNVWIGTVGTGLNMFDGKHMLKLTTEEGISDNTIRSIIVDRKENTRPGYASVWISTDDGIDHIEAKPNPYVASDVLITRHHKQDGLLGLDFTSNSGFMDKNGRAWWGSIKGVTTLKTNEIYIDSTIPKVRLQNVSLEQNYVDFNSLADSIAQGKHWFIGEKKELDLTALKFSSVIPFANYPKDLELPYNINNISFNYMAINWHNGHKIRYTYLLEGADKEWHPITADVKAIYTNLGPGHYTFKVKAKGVSDVWSAPLEYKFVIDPPWWQTTLAYILYVAALITAVFLFINIRTRALRQRQKELEHIIEERTADVVSEKTKVEEKNKIIEEKQKEIFDSLQYAKQIQALLLANHKLVNETLPDSFVMFKPRDIVSGDFYWAAKKEDRFYLAVCDSTGHGVPGAFMSLLNINFLNEAVIEKNISEPNEIFNYVRKRLIDNISQQGRQDGMDGILICVNEHSKKITYAAANNSPVIISDQKLNVLDADKMPIGKGEKNEAFKLYSVEMQKGDMMMLYTDGYADQFGGPKGKKFKYKPLNDLLLQNHKLPVIEQEQHLYAGFEKWKGDLEQVDDVCILGFRL